MRRRALPVGRVAVAAVLAVVVGGGCGGDAPSPTSTSVPAVPTTSLPTTSAPTPVRPAFSVEVRPVTAADLGASWRPGCPVGPEALRSLRLPHVGDDGAVHQGELVVAADQVEVVAAAFRAAYEAGFPIARMEPVARYGGDDQASMRADNTSAFNCRPVAGTDRWSEHAYGRAVDVNPLRNPYVRADGTVDPPEGAPWADRTRDDPGMLHDGDALVAAFEARGWVWGGRWRNGKDHQHLSATGR